MVILNKEDCIVNGTWCTIDRLKGKFIFYFRGEILTFKFNPDYTFAN